ncbi:hypothetical protein [Methylobacterium sp. Leaf102]|uniref:hypothetical protein n=1 Tax=Methylobacterium sp. Leaf102 TaxID=1736253 RepID=UPI000AAB2798|nr:hypothetical protein [Methylobacterium sp. Leaf102]
MGECPEYRVRLFMSVDLVGSTAFKAKHGDRRDPGEPYPVWLNRTKSFYRQFPNLMNGHYKDYLPTYDGSENFSDRVPKVWKTVGDEIIFCIRIVCLEHLACCVRSFTKALSEYGSLINEQEPELDVKGCTWIASFPAPNATVTSASRFSLDPKQGIIGDQLNEEDEKNADINPSEYDFLGKQIDTGFRVSKFAQAHELGLSIDLAWLLTMLRHMDLVDYQFTYRGKEQLKGVIGGAPYPVITVQTERSPEKRELDSLERSVSGLSFAEPISLRNYIHQFMHQHKVEIPIIPSARDKFDIEKLPQCYKDLTAAWEVGIIEEGKRTQSNEEAEAFVEPSQFVPAPPETPSNIDEINMAIDKLVEVYWSKGQT